MNIFEDIAKSGSLQRIFWSIIVTLFCIILYKIISRFLAAKEKKNSRILSSKKNKTFLRMFRSVIGTALATFDVLTILQIFGVNVGSMLAGVGIASIVIGFALQDALKDIIRGFEIISDSYYDIGDVIKYGDNLGQVLSIGLRTTKIQDINTMNIVSIANRDIDKVEVTTGYIYLPVPLPYEIKPDAANDLMLEITENIKALEQVNTAEYQGLSKIDTSSLNYQIAIQCDPMNVLSVRRAALGVVTDTLAKRKLRLPYAHVDVRTKGTK